MHLNLLAIRNLKILDEILLRLKKSIKNSVKSEISHKTMETGEYGSHGLLDFCGLKLEDSGGGGVTLVLGQDLDASGVDQSSP